MSGLFGSTRPSLPGWCRVLEALGIATEEPPERSAPFPGIGESSGGAACAGLLSRGRGLAREKGPCRNPFAGKPAKGAQGRSSQCLGRQDCSSSPRARGTRWRSRCRRGRCRFIPAGAGNTWTCRKSPTMGSVHPRGRGEHTSPRIALDAAVGSSPRARGTPGPPSARQKFTRFIPAGAGNTRPARSSSIICCGSSPRARGTRDGLAKISFGSRFIPAGAGNTAWPGQAVHRSAVHPRGRGEHLSITATTSGANGSSPRARRTQYRIADIGMRMRFIPAGAGNTGFIAAPPVRYPVHPRGRGEHAGKIATAIAGYGSSPRARGTPRCPCESCP